MNEREENISSNFGDTDSLNSGEISDTSPLRGLIRKTADSLTKDLSQNLHDIFAPFYNSGQTLPPLTIPRFKWDPSLSLNDFEDDDELENNGRFCALFFSNCF